MGCIEDITACLLSGGKADMAFCGCLLLRSLFGVKRTWPFALHMSAFDPKRTWAGAPHMAALGGKAGNLV